MDFIFLTLIFQLSSGSHSDVVFSRCLDLYWVAVGSALASLELSLLLVVRSGQW